MEATCQHRLGLCRSCPGGVWEERADLSRKGLEVRPGWLGGRRSPKLSAGRAGSPPRQVEDSRSEHARKLPHPEAALTPSGATADGTGASEAVSLLRRSARPLLRPRSSEPGTCSLHLCQGQVPAPAGPRRAHGCQSASLGAESAQSWAGRHVRRDRTACFVLFDFASRKREPLGRRPPGRRTQDATVSS